MKDFPFLPYDMLRLIFLFVASLESTSFRMDIVEMLSDLKTPSPFLQNQCIFTKKSYRSEWSCKHTFLPRV